MSLDISCPIDERVVFQVRIIHVEILWLEPLWSSYINMHYYYVGMYSFERRVQAHSDEFRNMSAV